MIEVVKKLIWRNDIIIDEYEVGDWADVILNNEKIYFGEIIDMQYEYIIIKCNNKDIKIYINEIKAFV